MIRHSPQPDPLPFRIGGARTAMTPQPDDAELAAEALLESLSGGRRGAGGDPGAERGTAEYYRAVSRRVREAMAAEGRQALRFVAWCEQELRTGGTPPEDLEAGLYRHLDAVERQEGDLKGRWQHALAMSIVRQTEANGV